MYASNNITHTLRLFVYCFIHPTILLFFYSIIDHIKYEPINNPVPPSMRCQAKLKLSEARLQLRVAATKRLGLPAPRLEVRYTAVRYTVVRYTVVRYSAVWYSTQRRDDHDTRNMIYAYYPPMPLSSLILFILTPFSYSYYFFYPVCVVGVGRKVSAGFLREENDLSLDRQDSQQRGENAR